MCKLTGMEHSSTLFMGHRLNAVCHCQCYSHMLCISFALGHSHTFLQIRSLHSSRNHLSGQHSLQHHSVAKPLPPLCTHFVLICTKQWRHPEVYNMFSKCKVTKEDGQETNAPQYPLLASFLQSRKLKNTIDTVKAQCIYLIAWGNMLFVLA